MKIHKRVIEDALEEIEELAEISAHDAQLTECITHGYGSCFFHADCQRMSCECTCHEEAQESKT